MCQMKRLKYRIKTWCRNPQWSYGWATGRQYSMLNTRKYWPVGFSFKMVIIFTYRKHLYYIKANGNHTWFNKMFYISEHAFSFPVFVCLLFTYSIKLSQQMSKVSEKIIELNVENVIFYFLLSGLRKKNTPCVNLITEHQYAARAIVWEPPYASLKM